MPGMNETVKKIAYTKVPLTKDDMIGPATKTIADIIIDAQKQAFKEGIEANTIVINENMVKIDEFVMSDKLGGIRFIPPMICGLNVYFTKDELPDNYSFAMFESNRPDRLAEFESIGMEPSELRKAAELYRKVKEIL